MKLVGIDHVGVTAQDDWHRSYKDTKRIVPYLPSFAAELEKRDWSEDRIYRRDGIGAKLLDCENLAAELSGRDCSAENIGNNLGGNMCGAREYASLDQLCPIRSSVIAAGAIRPRLTNCRAGCQGPIRRMRKDCNECVV